MEIEKWKKVFKEPAEVPRNWPEIYDFLEAYYDDKPNGRLLDVACSTGKFLSQLPRLGFVEIYGLDLSYYCCAVAFNRITKKVVTSNMIQLPFKNKSFDTLTCLASVNYLENKQDATQLINEFDRVTKDIIIISYSKWRPKFSDKNFHHKEVNNMLIDKKFEIGRSGVSISTTDTLAYVFKRRK